MKINGYIASNGVSISHVYKLKTKIPEINSKFTNDPSKELLILKKSKNKAINDLIKLKDSVNKNDKNEFIKIFDAHIEIIKDPDLNKQVSNLITDKSYTAVSAFYNILEDFAVKFDSLEDEYMKERAADIRDVSKRVIYNLLDIKHNDLSSINKEVILVANDISPSDVAKLNKQFIKGIVTNFGGITSHSAIISRSLGIPFIVGMKDIYENVIENELIILDAMKGFVITNPVYDEINKYQKVIYQNIIKQDKLLKYKNIEAMTKDLHKVIISSNIINLEDAIYAKEVGAKGIGLFRTELLYINKSLPLTEDEQFIIYHDILKVFPKDEVIIRTLDIGGDKHLSYLKDNENNRGLELSLNNLKLFKVQLKALLRSSIFGNLNIMFPYVTSLNQLNKAKEILSQCEKELTNNNYLYNKKYKLGIMIELEDVAVNIKDYINHVDFLSIGTNDLVNNVLRTSRNTNDSSKAYHPKVLRLIKNIIEVASSNNIKLSICGEMAFDKTAIPILLGLGLKNFSVSSINVLPTKKFINNQNYNKILNNIDNVLLLKSSKEVKKYVEQNLINKDN